MSDLNVSFAQNGEDIVLWRALQHIQNGVYIDVGANHPTVMSVTRKFYDAGWSGIAIEPNPEYAALLRAERPRDTVYEAVASDMAEQSVQFHLIEGTGLSTLVDDISAEHQNSGWVVQNITVPVISLTGAIEQAGLADGDLHFLSIDTEGAEAQVLASLDFTRFRPWVLIIEATAPLSTKQVHEGWQSIVESAGYDFCFFDGLSRFYVARERADELRADLAYPAGVLDEYVTIDHVELTHSLARAREELVPLVEGARRDADLLERTTRELDSLRLREADLSMRLERSTRHEAELGQLVADLQGTMSWRITGPLRRVRSLAKKGH